MRILMIEDEEGISYFVKKNLQEQGFGVDVAKEGNGGEFLALTNDYDVAIVDLNIPNKNGLEICKNIRAKERNFPILILTVNGEIRTKVELLEAGADDYLTKPFSMEELNARIKALVRRKYNATSNKLIFDDFEMDLALRTVRRGKKDIKLRRKEFSLLEFFLRNPEEVISRTNILEHVWDINADPFTNTLDVHIRYLRKKINVSGKPRYIKTVHGVGYRFK